ncbi:methyltransferase family protein [Orenia metallireducens]|jgi:ubiquinone/menaquinone biosynthesis C-methylase UbiE|uniref:Methyltransferase domain-containing protein n=1 Tax=Orenia metallireducens TaxID=1413210 RepID=A0A285HHZ8_9FIRM|nr:class I SAM-dependent methyltransferase [Orenia metallireducens]PRX27205.1 methyltransferase family protein [Orenia metallireducens]SNY35345.1 Methyltransferase domain-containing protein [Orenia metallireducens]
MGSKKYFDEVAKDWDVMRSEFFSESVKEKAYSVAKVKEGKAADIGAGTGFITEGLIKRGIEVIAVDQSLEMLNKLKEKFGDKGYIECRQGNAEKLPLEDGEVDYVFANMFLHHVEKPVEVIKEMARGLKDGGKLVITDLDKHNFEFLRRDQYDRWLGFDREDIAKWFIQAGLRDINVDCVGSNCCTTKDCNSEKVSISIFIASGTK